MNLKSHEESYHYVRSAGKKESLDLLQLERNKRHQREIMLCREVKLTLNGRNILLS